ncbi:carbohydrate ABC transporter, N-acetylglucosamine/diacetylchitobiose-binding protein [Streptomyces sp. AJS327]|uniref:N-acetylglucosamine/diacetylchitobiose ABC transporter substrate-binding protein n=1 Tax=Streptomyces sp. AJS327 TaxID=2545265 RepID=UPI0015DE1776|nr:N-acetylglucosamine/diacetylchitobiose ABC transporter substrate-binding protein [Streptomyces sp. AJS327]MBA0052044.1 carbohydrate ABC transporter, N-acetylglucosamine/diacetylchitobiose-binding protein [Streptomyces sp. AJS327]
MGSTHVNRRDLVKRTAAVGLVAAPGMGLLSSCATGGDDGGDKVEKGKKSKDNPLGANKDADLEVVIFNGGYGDQYAKDNHKLYEKTFGKVKHSKTQKIRTKLQPRMVKGNPPDVINNSGAEEMDIASLIKDGQAADLTPLLDAPSYDDPSKKIRDILLPGVIERGQIGSEKMYQLSYSYTIYGVWYSKTALEKLEIEYPKNWDEMLAACAKAKKQDIAGWTYAGKHPYYFSFVLYPFFAKIGGEEVLRKIDNLEPNAWKQDAVKQGFEAFHELYAKGYVLKGTPGIDHIQSQTQWTKGRALFLPNGSWVENESRKTTPKDFDMAVSPIPSLDKADKMPFETMYCEGSEPFMVPTKAKNVEGGMEWLRLMLSKQSTENFIQLVSAPSAVKGAGAGLKDLDPGVTSALDALDKAGDNIVMPRIRDWYLELHKDKIGGAIAEMMSGDIEPAEAVKRCQTAADEVAKDKSIKKYKR